ncbi:hypothetical protein HBB16_21560 [Pseudonocardia sp. MCCB 268]|nr:hypothetical protein [Pseudonocardia cytotoxica]
MVSSRCPRWCSFFRGGGRKPGPQRLPVTRSPTCSSRCSAAATRASSSRPGTAAAARLVRGPGRRRAGGLRRDLQSIARNPLASPDIGIRPGRPRRPCSDRARPGDGRGRQPVRVPGHPLAARWPGACSAPSSSTCWPGGAASRASGWCWSGIRRERGADRRGAPGC